MLMVILKMSSMQNNIKVIHMLNVWSTRLLCHILPKPIKQAEYNLERTWGVKAIKKIINGRYKRGSKNILFDIK